MTKEDYIQYYIQGSDHYLIPKDVFDELYDEMNNLKQDTQKYHDIQKYKEVIDKSKEVIDKSKEAIDYLNINTVIRDELLDILKEVE